MSFEPCTPPPRSFSKGKGPPECRVGMWKFPRSQFPPRLSITLGEAALVQLGPIARYEIAIGKGDDAHLARITRTEHGGFVPNKTGQRRRSGFHFRFLVEHRRFPNCAIQPDEAGYEVKSGALFVTLPAWAFDEAAKRDREKRDHVAGAAVGVLVDDSIGKHLDIDARSRLAAMAKTAGKSPALLAAELLTSVIEDDAAAEGEDSP